MAVYAKNNTASPAIWVGQEIQPGDYYLISDSERRSWATDETVLNCIINGRIIIATDTDAAHDITYSPDALAVLKEELPIDSDTKGLEVSLKYAANGWHEKLHEFEFCTSNASSLIDRDIDDNEYGYGTVTMYDENDVVTVVPAECVKTVLDWTPTHDYSLKGGWVKTCTQVTDNVYVWAQGAPGIPSAASGSKTFVEGVNLVYTAARTPVGLSGSVGIVLPYVEYGTSGSYYNTLRFVVRHPAGYELPMQVALNIFLKQP